MEDRFKFFLGSVDAVSSQFNLILANLQAPTHMEMFDHYRRLLPLKGDLLVVSGFDDAYAASMEKELAQRGFIVVEQVKVYGTTAALTPESSYIWVGFGLKRISSDP
jgi:ribosomal protein L11 methylase PrmA